MDAALDGIGLRVALAGRDAEKLERTKSELSQAGGPALVVPCDVADRAQVKRSVASVLVAYRLTPTSIGGVPDAPLPVTPYRQLR